MIISKIKTHLLSLMSVLAGIFFVLLRSKTRENRVLKQEIEVKDDKIEITNKHIEDRKEILEDEQKIKEKTRNEEAPDCVDDFNSL